MLTFDEAVRAFMAYGNTRDLAEKLARKSGFVTPGIEAPDVDEDALEKVIEHEGDKVMLALGFKVIRFSQPRATKQTPGIADRRYYRRPRAPGLGGPWTATNMRAEAVVLWWEAKAATGKQTPAERDFQEEVEACGETYVLGTHDVLIQWLVDHQIATRAGDTLEPVAF
jgi:hypothetical protein